MSKENPNAPWIDKKGRPITWNDCKNAVHHAISTMLKEWKTNPAMKTSDSLHFTYERYIGILEVMREKFDLLDKQTKKVERKTVKKRKRMIH